MGTALWVSAFVRQGSGVCHNCALPPSAGDLWARFVTEHQEDQDALGRESFQRYKFRPIITNFTGSVSEVIRHRFGDSSQYARSVRMAALECRPTPTVRTATDDAG